VSYNEDTNRITRLHDTIKELRAEVERLQEVIKANNYAHDMTLREASAEVEQLRNEVRKLLKNST